MFRAESHGAWWRGCQEGPSADEEEELCKEDTPSSVCKDLKERYEEHGWV